MNGQLRNTIGLVLAFASAPATAQVADHLECYRLKDSLARTIYTADLSGLAVEPGCTVKVPATLMCVETPKQNVTPTPPGAPSASAAGRFLCYKVKCAKQTIPAELVTDQFGSRTVQASVSKLLCAPVAPCPVGGEKVGGACWYIGDAGESCDTVCDNKGLGFDDPTLTYAGSNGTTAHCEEVLTALGFSGTPNELDCSAVGGGLGCLYDSSPTTPGNLRCTMPGTSGGYSSPYARRACACK